MYKKIIQRITLLGLAIAMIIPSIALAKEPPTEKGVPDTEGGLILDNHMQYKPVKKPKMQTETPELIDMFNKIQAEKDSGAWELKRTEMTGAEYVNERGYDQTVVGKNGGGLNSIGSPYNQTYKNPSNLVKNQAKKYGWDVNSQYINTSEYSELINNNLATKFDVRSPGSIMSAEQWKAFIKHSRPNQKAEYNVNGKKVQMYAHEMYEKVVDAIYRVSAEEYQNNGRTINPDFLIAITIHETGWGSNRLSRLYNSWFSMNATNANTAQNAYKYNTVDDSVRDALPRIYKFTEKGDWRFDDTKGPSIMGINTTYALKTQNGPPTLGWTQGITSLIESCARFNNVQIPKF